MKRLLPFALCTLLAALPSSAAADTRAVGGESAGTFSAGARVCSGRTAYANLVPGSVRIAAGGFVWNDDGKGRLVFVDPNGGASEGGGGSTDETGMSPSLSGSGTILYSSGAWSIQISPAMTSSQTVSVDYGYYAGGDEDGESSAREFWTICESGGTFVSGTRVASGMTTWCNIVPGSLQIAAGEYVWNDDGNGRLVFVDPNGPSSSSGSGGAANEIVVQAESVGMVSSSRNQKFELSHANLVPGSVVVSAGAVAFTDDGSGNLAGSESTASGIVNYETGCIALRFDGAPPEGAVVKASYKCREHSVVTTSLSGSGTILYSSGAWTIQLNPAMPYSRSIVVRFSYSYGYGDSQSIWFSGHYGYRNNPGWIGRLDGKKAGCIYCVQETCGVFAQGKTVVSGKTGCTDVVPGSLQVLAGDCVWNDDGKGRLVFVDPNGGSASSVSGEGDRVIIMKSENVGTFRSDQAAYPLRGGNVVPGSLVVSVGDWVFFDDGAGNLVPLSGNAATGAVDYETGAMSFRFDGVPPEYGAVTATYKRLEPAAVAVESFTGSGTIRYSSGAWSLQLSPAMPSSRDIFVRYLRYEENYHPGLNETELYSPVADQATVGKRTWSFEPNDDGRTCTVVGVFPANGALKIPARLGGLAVTKVDTDNLLNPEVTALSIPAGVARVNFPWNNLSTCRKLKTIKVAAKNKTFSASGNVLFDKKKTILLAVAPAKKGKYKVPASVTRIDWSAFDGSSLSAVTLPAKLKIIGCGAFSNARSIKKLAIPASVVSIGDSGEGWRQAFAPQIRITVAKKNKNYSAAGGVLFDKKKTALLHCPSSKKGTFKVPASVKTIAFFAFQECTLLEKVVLPQGLTGLGSYAFAGCTSLKKADLPKGLTHLGTGAFSVCTSLRKLSIPASVRFVGDFYPGGDGVWEGSGSFNPAPHSGVASYAVASGNKVFASVDGCLLSKSKAILLAVPSARKGAFKIPATVKAANDQAFAGCGKLTAVSIPAGMVALPNFQVCVTLNAKKKKNASSLKKFAVGAGNPHFKAVGGVLFSKDGKTLVAFPVGKKPKKGVYTVPKGVKEIASHAFEESLAVKKIVVPDSVEDVREWAFAYCPRLAAVRLPAKLAAIGNGLFQGDARLKSVKIPATVKTIGDGAFFDCPELASVVVPSEIRKVGSGAFGSADRKAGLKKLSLPSRNFGVCDVARQELPASCKIVYRDKTPVYRIRFLPNGGSLPDDSVDAELVFHCDDSACWTTFFVSSFVKRGKAVNLRANPFENWGHAFLGWATSPMGAVKYKDKASVKDLAAAGRTAALYAVWKSVKTTWKFNPNGGSGSMAPIVVDYDDEDRPDVPACAFTRQDWTFDHWNTKPDDSGDSYREGWGLDVYDGGKDSTATLYAIWVPDDPDDSPDPGADEDAPAFSEAAPSEGIVLHVADDLPWTESVFDGEPCFESGAAGDGGTSTLLASAEGSGTLAFRWRTSSEEGRDIVFFSVDGKDVSSRSGLDDDWAAVSLRIEGDGPHALSWTYAKDASGSAGDDRARLADVVWLED